MTLERTCSVIRPRRRKAGLKPRPPLSQSTPHKLTKVVKSMVPNFVSYYHIIHTKILFTSLICLISDSESPRSKEGRNTQPHLPDQGRGIESEKQNKNPRDFLMLLPTFPLYYFQPQSFLMAQESLISQLYTS